MREVNIKVTYKGWNMGAHDLVLNKEYPATRYEPGEDDGDGPGTDVYYVLRDEAGERCGLYVGYNGIVIEEV